MFILYNFQNLRAAQAFSDYLTSLEITNRIERDEFNYQLIIEHSTQQNIASIELQSFLQNPNDSKYLAASWHSGSANHESVPLSTEHSSLLVNFMAHGGAVTNSIFALCIIIYGLTSLGLFDPIQSIFAFFKLQPFDYSQAWRFITPAFLHFSVLHIVFNLLWWWQLAGIIEKQQGKKRLILLFLFTAIASNCAQYFLVGPYFGGLSGVVYGLVGYCWLFGVLNQNSKINLPNSYFIFLLACLGLGFVNLLPVNVANYAHLVGLLSGLLSAVVCSVLSHKATV